MKLSYQKILEQREKDKNDAMDAIFRRGKKYPTMSDSKFAKYLKVVNRNVDQSNAGNETLRLELINNMGGYQYSENIRVQKIEAINPLNDRVKKLQVQQTPLNGLNMNLSPPSRQLDIEYYKYQFAVDIATKNNIEGFVSNSIAIIEMKYHIYSIITFDQLATIVERNKYEGLNPEYVLSFIRGIFASRSLIFMYVPNPDILTPKLNEIANKLSINELLSKIVPEEKEISGNESIITSKTDASARRAIFGEKKEESSTRTLPVDLKKAEDDSDEMQNKYYARVIIDIDNKTGVQSQITNSKIRELLRTVESLINHEKKLVAENGTLSQYLEEYDDGTPYQDMYTENSNDIIKTTGNSGYNKYKKQIEERIKSNIKQTDKNKVDLPAYLPNLDKPYMLKDSKYFTDIEQYHKEMKKIESIYLKTSKKIRENEELISKIDEKLKNSVVDISKLITEETQKRLNDIRKKYAALITFTDEKNKQIDNYIRDKLDNIQKKLIDKFIKSSQKK